MKRFVSAALAALIAAAPATAQAWETQTHLGLTEQAALAADLDAWLRSIGHAGGMFETLTVPPADAPDLFAALANHSPIDGFVPDKRGQQPALSWLLAGAALADATPRWAANHFFDPWRSDGWRAPGRDVVDRTRDALEGASGVPGRGVPAPDWAASAENPLGLPGFLDQYEKAIRSGTPGERSRHMAGALVAAGAVMHVLGDLGSPSHARNDGAAHLARSSEAAGDAGARFERLAALAWGRLGVPAAAEIPSRPTFRAFFTAPGDDVATAGLADWTATRFFSEGTLPRGIKLSGLDAKQLAAALQRSLARPAPTLNRKLSRVRATQPQGTTLRDASGVCLARYRDDRGRLSWWMDDDCVLEQAAAILPVAAGYEAALLRWLSRGQLAIAVGADRSVQIAARSLALGAGAVTVLAEDGRGIRTEVARADVATAADGAQLAVAPMPAEARYAVALFRGVDGAGEPVVAVARVELP